MTFILKKQPEYSFIVGIKSKSQKQIRRLSLGNLTGVPAIYRKDLNKIVKGMTT